MYIHISAPKWPAPSLEAALSVLGTCACQAAGLVVVVVAAAAAAFAVRLEAAVFRILGAFLECLVVDHQLEVQSSHTGWPEKVAYDLSSSSQWVCLRRNIGFHFLVFLDQASKKH